MSFIESLIQGLWFLLRVFVLSIDQRVLWGLLILVLAVFILFRSQRGRPSPYEEPSPAQNTALRDFERWRFLFTEEPNSAGEFGSLQRELAWKLCAVYASRKRIRADYEVRDAFVERRVSLDEGIYSFLFTERPAKRRKKAAYDREVEACLDYLEEQLEIRDDDE